MASIVASAKVKSNVVPWRDLLSSLSSPQKRAFPGPLLIQKWPLAERLSSRILAVTWVDIYFREKGENRLLEIEMQ